MHIQTLTLRNGLNRNLWRHTCIVYKKCLGHHTIMQSIDTKSVHSYVRHVYNQRQLHQLRSDTLQQTSKTLKHNSISYSK